MNYLFCMFWGEGGGLVRRKHVHGGRAVFCEPDFYYYSGGPDWFDSDTFFLSTAFFAVRSLRESCVFILVTYIIHSCISYFTLLIHVHIILLVGSWCLRDWVNDLVNGWWWWWWWFGAAVLCRAVLCFCLWYHVIHSVPQTPRPNKQNNMHMYK